MEREEDCLSDHRRPRQIVSQHVSDESPRYWGAAPALVPKTEGSPPELKGAVLQGTRPRSPALVSA